MRHIWTVKDLGLDDDGYYESVLLRDGTDEYGCFFVGLTQTQAHRMAASNLRLFARQTPVRIGDLSKHPERWQYSVAYREWVLFRERGGEYDREAWADQFTTLTVRKLKGIGWCFKMSAEVGGRKLTDLCPTLAAAKRAAERAAAEMERG